MPPAIAILGWGSLIWDQRAEFDQHHADWVSSGPELPIEFTRVSKTRAGALTLVLDYENGTPCTVAYARSKRSDAEDAICDLRSREGTTWRNIGYLYADGSAQQAKDNAALVTISAWAKANKFDVVIWTDLSSNFQGVTGTPFSIQSALTYIAELPPAGKAAASAYVWQAPALVTTPLRAALQAQPWFSPP
jgi:hypothetical protein